MRSAYWTCRFPLVGRDGSEAVDIYLWDTNWVADRSRKVSLSGSNCWEVDLEDSLNTCWQDSLSRKDSLSLKDSWSRKDSGSRKDSLNREDSLSVEVGVDIKIEVEIDIGLEDSVSA